jgi:hypothetical protein
MALILPASNPSVSDALLDHTHSIKQKNQWVSVGRYCQCGLHRSLSSVCYWRSYEEVLQNTFPSGRPEAPVTVTGEPGTVLKPTPAAWRILNSDLTAAIGLSGDVGWVTLQDVTLDRDATRLLRERILNPGLAIGLDPKRRHGAFETQVRRLVAQLAGSDPSKIE